MANCPDPSVLRRMLDDVAFEHAHAAIAEHLGGCAICQRTIEHLAADERAWSDMAEALAAAPPRLPVPLREALARLDVRSQEQPPDDLAAKKLKAALIVVWSIAGVLGILALAALGWAWTIHGAREAPVAVPPVVVQEPVENAPGPGKRRPPRPGGGGDGPPLRKPDGEPRPKRPL